MTDVGTAGLFEPYDSGGSTLRGACGYCGCLHDGTRPKVKAIEYYPNGTVKRVEFKGDDDG